ncbi:putative transposase subunit B [Pseudomonas aeruginosa VRFPA02]|nr:putative transposase subunit B [Pseudomonas aeruginosa VRFPA02]
MQAPDFIDEAMQVACTLLEISQVAWEAVEMATLKWVHWYNHQRLLSSIGYIPPAEAEANFHQQQANQAMAA